VSNNPRYIQAIRQGTLLDQREALTARDRYNELVMTGLRTAVGISPEELRRATGVRPKDVDGEAWTRALNRGRLVEHQPGWFHIPERDWITGDQVASSLFAVD
jgi:oxygen-independent coproporphyrinogen-3 oxidase